MNGTAGTEKLPSARAILEEDLQSFDGLVRLSERIIKVVEQEVRETDKYFQKSSFAD